MFPNAGKLNLDLSNVTFDSIVVQNTCQLFQLKLVAVAIILVFRGFFKFCRIRQTHRMNLCYDGNNSPNQNVLVILAHNFEKDHFIALFSQTR